MRLSPHWFADPILDAEYKHYELLAFLQYVDGQYKEKRLFPYSAEVRNCTNELVRFMDNLTDLDTKIPKELTTIDLTKLILEFEKTHKAGPEIEEIRKIAEGSLPLLKKNLAHACELIEELKRHIELCTVGLMPLNVQFGYLMLQQDRDTRVYEYKLSKLVNREVGSSTLSTKYVDTWKRSPSNNFEQIKLDLINSNDPIANPAAFGFVSSVSLPAIETFLPLAKQMTIELISKGA